MTNAEFKAVCQILFGGTNSKAAQWIGVSERNCLRFAAGEKPIGPELSQYMINGLRALLMDGEEHGAGVSIIRKALEPEILALS